MLFLQPLVARKAQTNWCADCLLSSGRKCVCDGSGGIRPTVPFGGKCSATERYVISFSQNKRDKSARAKGGVFLSRKGGRRPRGFKPKTWNNYNEPFAVNADGSAQYLADVATYGLFTYEEFAEIYDVPEAIFEAVGGENLKVSIGKGFIDYETLGVLIERYSEFFE